MNLVQAEKRYEKLQKIRSKVSVFWINICFCWRRKDYSVYLV